MFWRRHQYDMLVEMAWPEDRKPSLRALVAVTARDLPSAALKAIRQASDGIMTGWKTVTVRHVDRTEMLRLITAAQEPSGE